METTRAHVVSSFTVIKGTQLEATYAAFRHWSLEDTQGANVAAVKRGAREVTGSANWLRDLAFTINRRYDTDGRDRVLVELAQAECPIGLWKPLVLWHMTRDEFLVRDFLCNWLFEQYRAGAWRIRGEDVHPYLAQLHLRNDVAMKETWRPRTTRDTASSLLRIAVDFGLMRGKIVREFVSFHVPDEAFLYLLHAAKEAEPNADALVHLPDWRMYLMSPDDVQRELFRLHQFRRLHYEVAGSIGELRLPYPTAAAYARAELIT